MKKIDALYLRSVSILAFVMLSLLSGCNDPDIDTATTDDVVITGYLQNHRDQFSDFLTILDQSGHGGFLGAYGTYTCFAPTNEAIAKYLEAKNISSLSDLEPEELTDIIRFHVLLDTLPTTTFTDGKLGLPTMYGQYLVTGAINTNGQSSIRVNRQANITESNIRTANGLIHVIDNVLEPANKTIAGLLEANPEYSIFLEAVHATGLYDTLNKVTTDEEGNVKWLTVVAQTNSAFAAAGLPDYASVEARYSHTGNPLDQTDSLYLFVAYRILPGIKYIADLVTAPSHNTLAPAEVITTKLAGTDVKINADVFRGVQEPGATLNRDLSDFAAMNGVLHTSVDNYAIKVRVPYPVYWDLADQPELRLMTNIFRKLGAPAYNVPLGTLKDVTWGGAATNTLQYVTQSPTGADQYVYGDRLTMNVRTGVIPWVEFVTPLLVKGKYKVWITYRKTNYNDMQAFFDGEALPRIFGLNPGPSYPTVPTVDDAAQQGWKLYTGGASTNFLGRMLGTIDVKTTDRHRFKIVGLTNRGGSTGNAFLSDMVHFIPIAMDQVYPRFNIDGTEVPRPN